jgi:hypothetical protein
MNRISKGTASEIAYKLTEKLAIEIKELEQQKQGIVKEQYQKTIESDLMVCFNKYKNYFKEQTIYVVLAGKSFGYFNVEAPVCVTGFSINQGEISDRLFSIDNTIKDLKANKNKLMSDIESALLNLVSYKKIEENFPEAAKFLPEIKQLPVIQLDKIREQLK